MELKSRRRIKMIIAPRTGRRNFVQIHAKKLRIMLPSSSKQSSRAGTPMRSTSTSEQLPELSDVQCYTCRRRHVKCDRILPHCAKCRKKGVECLGYQKPLRWADGVAVRGKLKGKSQPVVDSKAMSIVQKSVQQQTASALQEAAHFGVHPSDNCCNNVLADESQLAEILEYYNSTICSEKFNVKLDDPRIAHLNPKYVQQLPRSIVNCLLGISAVHMASRNPENPAIERMALETKVNVFQSHNQLLRVPQNQLDQRPDVVICCGVLIFAMDLFEHGMSRWMIHTLGMMHVMSSFGGIENLAFYYPHLHIPLLHCSLFETMWIVMSHVPLTKPKQVSRNALELLINSNFANTRIFNGCPTALTLSIWDIASCAQRVLGSGHPISFADMHKRERILVDVLSFQPDDDKSAREEYYQDGLITASHLQNWDSIGMIWKAAIIILVLRYLYFGRPELTPATATAPPTLNYSGSLSFVPEDQYFVGTEEPNFDDYLTTGAYTNVPLSRSPSASPLPSPRLPTEPPNSNLWDARYDIHTEAFNTLASTLAALQAHLDPVSLRCVLVPAIILALVSRPNSKERALCTFYFAKFEEFMAGPLAGSMSAEKLEFQAPWEKLDAYSEMVEMQNGVGMPLEGSAPEWNWWDMLKQVDLNIAWPVTAGNSHLEQGAEFWAFKIIASVANEECFNAWLREPTPSLGSTSSA